MKIELTEQERTDLKEMYVQYTLLIGERSKAQGSERETIRAEINELKAEYSTKFPSVSSDHSLSDVKELIYDKNQLQFIEDANDQGMPVDYGYSGRCMYGDTCPSVVVERLNDFRTSAKWEYDLMGLGYVIYAK